MEEKKAQFVKDIEQARNEGTLDDFYEKYAGEYDAIMSTTGYDEIQDYASSLMKKFLTANHPLILDVGCGTGYSGLYLKKAGFQKIHGTDPSPSSLKESEKKGVYSKVFEGMITDAEELKCGGDTYDGIFCIGTITKGHLELGPALREFRRVTKPGGIVIFTIRNDKLDQKEMMSVMGEVMQNRAMELILIEHRNYFVGTFCLCCVFKVL